MTDLEQRIREAAEKSTPGEWELQDSNSWRRIGTSRKDGGVICPDTYSRTDHHPDLKATYDDLRWVVLCCPDNILNLLNEKDAEIESLRDRIATLHQ